VRSENADAPHSKVGMTFRTTRFVSLALLLLVLCGWSATAASARTSKILAFGDSLTAGFGLPPEQSFPAQLEKRLRADGLDVQVINGGQSGDTTAGGLARLDWSLAENPDLVILELGANDMLRGIPPATVRANLDKLIGRIKASGAKLLLAGMQASPNWGKKYEEEFNPIYPELARSHGVALYPFFLEEVVMNPELNQPDGLHPNARGVALIVERIAPDIAKLLGERS
jgi:acyl-CoA thioesterase-1